MAREVSTDTGVHFWKGKIEFESNNTEVFSAGDRQSIRLTFAGDAVTVFFPASRRKDVASILSQAGWAVLANATKSAEIAEPERVAEAA